MKQPDESEQRANRMRIVQEAEKEEQRLYSLWERLTRKLIGKDEDQERRAYATRNPDTE